MSEPRHACDDGCVCPIHHTPLYYSPAQDDHACQDITCEYGHGGAPLGGVQEPDWEKIRAYGRGEISGRELTGEEMELASDGLDALDCAP
jgi:hypothetical protein